MTEVIKQKEIDDIKNIIQWPMRPILPMKNRQRSWRDNNSSGFLVIRGVKTFPEGPVTVYIGNVWSNDIIGFENLPQETYPSLEALVDAGWVGD